MNKTINLPELSRKTIDTLKNMAVDIESNDLRVAKELMLLAHLARPNGLFIKNKLNQYKKIL